MAQAPSKPLHKPSESHTLDEVMKSLQDLIRNELVEPQAGQQPDIAKRSVAPPKITPTVKPASRWEARGLGKAKPKPTEEVDVDAVLSSLRDIVSQELAVHTPRRSPPIDPRPSPDSPPERTTASDDALRIEWTENLDAAAALLDMEDESVPTTPEDARATTIEARQTDSSEAPSLAEPEPPSVDVPAVDGSTRSNMASHDHTPTEISIGKSPPTSPGADNLAPPSTPETLRGEQQSFLFDSTESTIKSLPPDAAVTEITFDLDALPDTIELDELTHTRTPTIDATTPPPVSTSPTDSTTQHKTSDDDVSGRARVASGPETPTTDTTATPPEPPPDIGSPEPAPLRLPDDFDAVTPTNVNAMPSIEFEPTGIRLARESAAKSPEPVAATPKTVDAEPTTSPQSVPRASDVDTQRETVPSSPATAAIENPDVVTPAVPAPAVEASVHSPPEVHVPAAPAIAASPGMSPTTNEGETASLAPIADAPPASERPGHNRAAITDSMTPPPPMLPSVSAREIAVRSIAKLNIELRRCGERTLDPRMIDRLQFVLQELLGDDPHKKKS